MFDLAGSFGHLNGGIWLTSCLCMSGSSLSLYWQIVIVAPSGCTRHAINEGAPVCCAVCLATKR